MHQIKFQFLIILACLFLLQACGSDPVRGNPDRAVDNYVELGLGYLSEGNRELARQNLNRALEHDSDSALANSAVAYLYETEGEPELAELHYDRALKSDKTFTQARNNYARFLHQNGRYQEARDQYKLVSDDVNYRLRYLGFIGLGLSEKALGNYDLAEAALARSLSLNPRSASASIELVELKMTQEDYVLAKEYLDRFEAISKSTPRSLSLGMQLADKFGDKNARESYSMALKNIYPDSREARSLVLAEREGETE